MDTTNIDELYENVDIGFSLGAAEIYLADYIMDDPNVSYTMHEDKLVVDSESIGSVKQRAGEEIQKSRQKNPDDVPDLSGHAQVIDCVIENACEIAYGHVKARNDAVHRVTNPGF